VANPYVGEIRMFGGNFAPLGWAFCDGQLLAIAENDALFNLIGTTYGGDGQTTFGLPDLRGRLPVHQGTDSTGQAWTLGQATGAEEVTLTVAEMPAHSHFAMGSSDQASTSDPAGAVLATLAAAGTQSAYGIRSPIGALDPSSLTSAGGSQPHPNLMPYACVSFIISLYGVYPPAN
jgi:microcystin-dependent protein